MLERPQGVYTLEHPQPLPPHLAPGSNSLTCLPLLLPVPPKWLSLSLLPRSLLALPFPILPLLLPFRSDTSPPPPPPSSSRSQTRSPPTRTPSPGPPFRGRKNKQNQIKFTCCSRASSTGALSCPKSARRNLPTALQLTPSLIPGSVYPSCQDKGSARVRYPITNWFLFSQGRCKVPCHPWGSWKTALNCVVHTGRRHK